MLRFVIQTRSFGSGDSQRFFIQVMPKGMLKKRSWVDLSIPSLSTIGTLNGFHIVNDGVIPMWSLWVSLFSGCSRRSCALRGTAM